MNGVGFIGAIIIGVAAGWIAEQVLKREHGLFTNLIVGVVGALIGGLLAGLIGISFGGWIGSLIVSSLGAIILLWALSLVKKGSDDPLKTSDDPLKTDGRPKWLGRNR